MPRAVWTGSISFGLVNVPVKLYPGTQSKDVHFHQFEAKTGKRIDYRRFAANTKREVDFQDIVKGYEVSKGKYVMVAPKELEAVEPGRSRTLEIEDFVRLEEIDPIYFDATYYIEPVEGAGKAYALLARTMNKTGRIGIGRFVMRTKQYLAAVRPMDDALVLATMYFGDEVRSLSDLNIPGRVKLTAKETHIAEQLVESLTTKFDPDSYKDTYRRRVLDLIKKKSKGEEIEVAEREEPAKIVDLMAALEASLERGGSAKRTRSTPRRRKAS
jgi:DNA end-binding protein Ku